MFLLCTWFAHPPPVRPERARQQHGLNAKNAKGRRMLFAFIRGPLAFFALSLLRGWWVRLGLNQ